MYLSQAESHLLEILLQDDTVDPQIHSVKLQSKIETMKTEEVVCEGG